MKKAPKAILLFLWVFFPLSAGAGERVTFDGVMDKVTRNAFDVKIAEKDIRISEASRKETLSLYHPALKGKWNSEYIKDLAGGAGDLTSVGNSVFGEPTSYRNSYSLNAEWLLYDFGARKNKRIYAEKDMAAKKAAHIQSIRDVQLETLRIYTELLLITRELDARKTLLGLQKELVSGSERLHRAGMLLKIDMVDDLLKTIKTVNAMEELNGRFQRTLHELSLFTRDAYKPDETEIGDFSEVETGKAFSVEKAPEYRIHDLEIEKKKQELAILRKDRLPRVDFYSGYIWYGKDTGSFTDSMEKIKEQNYRVGISATFSFFSGFKTRAQIEKATVEVEKLQLEKDKKVYELTAQYQTTGQTVMNLAKEITSRKEMIQNTTEKRSMMERLSAQNIAGEKEVLQLKIELANEQWELQQAEIGIKSAKIQLMLLATEIN